MSIFSGKIFKGRGTPRATDSREPTATPAAGGGAADSSKRDWLLCGLPAIARKHARAKDPGKAPRRRADAPVRDTPVVSVPPVLALPTFQPLTMFGDGGGAPPVPSSSVPTAAVPKASLITEIEKDLAALRALNFKRPGDGAGQAALPGPSSSSALAGKAVSSPQKKTSPPSSVRSRPSLQPSPPPLSREHSLDAHQRAPSLDETVDRIAGRGAPAAVKDHVRTHLAEIAPEDREDFSQFLDAAERAGLFAPRYVLNSLAALVRIPPEDRRNFVFDLYDICDPEATGLDARDEEAHVGIIPSLAQFSPEHRRPAGLNAVDLSVTSRDLSCILDSMSKLALEDPADYRRFRHCAEAVCPQKAGYKGNIRGVAETLGTIGLERGERAARLVEQHFPELVPHVRMGELLTAMDQVADEDMESFMALLHHLNERREAPATPADIAHHVVALARCDAASRRAVTCVELQKFAALDRGSAEPFVSSSPLPFIHNDSLRRGAGSAEDFAARVDTFLKLKESTDRFETTSLRQHRRIALVEQCVAHLCHPDMPDSLRTDLNAWVAGLDPQGLERMKATLDIPEPPVIGEMTPIEERIADSASKLTPTPRALPAEGTMEAWHRCVDTMAAEPAMASPWDTLPLRFLLPFRERMGEALRNHHPVALDRKAFDIADPEHRLADYYSLLEETHLWKCLSLESNKDFNFEKAKEIQGNAGVRRAFLAKAEKINRFEADCLAYEALRMERRMIEPARQKAKALDIPLMVMTNATSGNTAGTPLGLRKIQERGVKVWSLKQPSTGTSSRPHALHTAPLTAELMAHFFEKPKPPLVLVLDFSKELHHPRAFRRFRNLAAAINQAWGLDASESWKRAGLDTTPFDPSQTDDPLLIERFKKQASGFPAPEKGLELHYASLTSAKLSTSFGENPVPFAWENVNGHAIVCVQTAISHEEIERAAEIDGDPVAMELIKTAKRLGVRHETGYFDDDDDAQNPWIFPSRRGNLKVNPPVHVYSRDSFKAMKGGTYASDPGASSSD